MSESISDKEFRALVSLLDDEDDEVYEHVKSKLISLGITSVPKLEAAWETSSDDLLQNRLEELIQSIQNDRLLEELKNWKKNDADDLLLGAILIAKFKYPHLDESVILSYMKKLNQSIWLELHSGLTSLEEVKVFNHVFYKLYGFHEDAKKKEIDLESGFINNVIDNKKGNSLTLGILYLAIAKQLNLPIYGVNLPFHFALAYCKRAILPEEIEAGAIDLQKEILFYINPGNDGAIFSRSDIDIYLEKIQSPRKKEYYNPCNNEIIIQALMNNQIYCFKKLGEIEQANKLKFFMNEVFKD